MTLCLMYTHTVYSARKQKVSFTLAQPPATLVTTQISILMSEALKLVRKKLINVIAELAKFADRYKNLPTLAFTHFQPAQPTTVGKRATLWTQEFLMDLEDLDYVLGSLKLLGSKGTTGTQASFLELFDGDQETIDKIDPMIAAKMGFKECYPVSGQTYSRKV